jgi:ribosomal protein S18 acetylase RimI-like enzyme
MTAGKADIVPDFAIRRPNPPDWSAIREILAASNFHRIGGSEMPSFPLQDCFVAERDGRIVGVAGYRVTGARTARTTLLAVHPAERRRGIGLALHAARQDYLRSRGIRTLYTNVDDEAVVAWYRRHFGYVETGRLIAKTEPFGRADRDAWINLKVEL